MAFFLISLSTFYIYWFLKTNKAINILERNKFNVKKYFKELFIAPIKTFGLIELSFIVLALIAFVTDDKVTGICTVIFYMGLSLIAIKGKPKFNFKAPNIRVLIITFLIFAAINVPIIIDCYNYQNTFTSFNPMFIYYIILYVTMYLLWFIVGVAGLINTLFMKKTLKKK